MARGLVLLVSTLPGLGAQGRDSRASLSRLRLQFLALGMVDIWGQRLLCGGECPVH